MSSETESKLISILSQQNRILVVSILSNVLLLGMVIKLVGSLQK